MTAQQGFLYEINAVKVLKPLGLVPKGFIPAGAGHDQPDLMLSYHSIQSGCELKITAASAGSLVLKYDPKKDKNNPWGFGTILPSEDEKKFLAEIAKSSGFFQDVKKLWTPKGIPYKFRDKPLIKDKKKQYEADLKNFTDIKREVSATVIEQYYHKKKTYYVNVGTHGFYMFGARPNPLKLEGVPTFASSAKVITRARVQYKGSGNYQFTFELQFSIPSSRKSPFNIAPVDGKSVNIIKPRLQLGCFE